MAVFMGSHYCQWPSTQRVLCPLLLSQRLRHFRVHQAPSLPLTLSLCGNSGWESRAWALQPRGGWIIRGWASPTPLPASDMEVTRAQGLRCDPAQPLDTNRNNWVARPGLWRHGQREQEIAIRRHMLLLNPNSDCSCQPGIMALQWAVLFSAVCGRYFFETETMLGNDWHEVNFRQTAVPEIVA